MTLARQGFYDGLTFHRVIPNNVVQAVDPRSDNEGGPGYTIRDELNSRPFLPGTVGIARDWADTGGSQFFITYSPQPQLDARYTAFGHVVAGMEVLGSIEPGDVIRSIDGQPIDDVAAFGRLISDAEIDSTVTLGLLRYGRPIELRVIVERERPQQR